MARGGRGWAGGGPCARNGGRFRRRAASRRATPTARWVAGPLPGRGRRPPAVPSSSTLSSGGGHRNGGTAGGSRGPARRGIQPGLTPGLKELDSQLRQALAL